MQPSHPRALPSRLLSALLLLSACSTSGIIEATPSASLDADTRPLDLPLEGRDALTDASPHPHDFIDVSVEPDGELCAPDCHGKACGDDGCGGDCGPCLGPQDLCVSGICACIPSCEGLSCGDDGCGGRCGVCSGLNEVCNLGACECAPDCDGLSCGDDGCGGSCGACADPSESCNDGVCGCIPDCAGVECGDDHCGGRCGGCEPSEACVLGACECAPSCANRDCGGDGCGGACGRCDAETERCDGAGRCIFMPCETALCGVCDEIDVSMIVGGAGTLGGGHAHGVIPEVFRAWPITSDLEISPAGGGTAFRIHHLPSQPSWPTVNGADGNPYREAAVIVACYDKPGVGVFCMSGEHWSMDHNDGIRGMDWPPGRPVAWVLVSSGAQKRTAIKYFEEWPHNQLPADHAINLNTVGTSLELRRCR